MKYSIARRVVNESTPALPKIKAQRVSNALKSFLDRVNFRLCQENSDSLLPIVSQRASLKKQ